MDNNIVNCTYCNNIYIKNNLKIHLKNCNKKPNPKNDYKLVSNIEGVYNHFFRKYNELFSNYLKDKTVALIGPAESIIGTKKGHLIDQFDIIIRLNKSLPLPKKMAEDIGSRTDILYNSLNTCDYPGQNKFNNDLLKNQGVKFLCCPYPFDHSIFKSDIISYIKKNKFEIPFRVISNKTFFQLENYLRTRPYTGTCAILDLLNYPIKYLYISGLDFYMTSYYSSYRRIKKSRLSNIRNNTIHNNKPQIQYLKDIYVMDERIILDNFLDVNLFSDYYKVLKELLNYENKIFNFDDQYLDNFFDLDNYALTYTILNQNFKNNNNNPYIIITCNENFNKQNNEYLLFLTNNNEKIQYLNKGLSHKKYIGNFYFNKGKYNFTSMYIDSYFLNFLKKILRRINILNCNIHMVIFFSILAFKKDKHIFNLDEMLNNWRIDKNEKKFLLFLKKKKLFNYF